MLEQSTVSGVLPAEMRKITTTRLWWIVLICVFLLGGGYAELPVVALGKGRIVLAGWCLVPLIIGVLSTVRSDVTE